MANLTINVAQVKWVGGVLWTVERAGATITRGQVVTRINNEYQLADANVQANSVVAGIALSDGYDGSQILIAPPGARNDFGASLAAGSTYILSDTPGALADDSDAAAGWYVTNVAVGIGTREAIILTNEPGLVP